MQNVIMNKVQELHEQIATAKHNLGKPQPLAANFTKKLHSISFLSNLISFFAGAEIFGVRVVFFSIYRPKITNLF